MRLIIVALSLATLSACGTCVGASCPDFEDPAPGTFDATVTASTLDDTGTTEEPYADETAIFTYTGQEAVLTYADEDGNVWEVRYTTTPLLP